MEDSTKRTKEVLEENDDVAHRPFFLTIFNSLLKLVMAIFRLLGPYAHRPTPSPPEGCGSYPPPTAADPPVDELGQEKGRLNPPPPPPPSNGGGPQTNLSPSDPQDEQ